jgi:predicted RecB family nuclease
VRRALQVGEESYSLKALERHHGFRRLERTVREGGGSIIAYETWLETQEDDLLETIRAYNEEDCRSTWSMRQWLHSEVRPEAAAEPEPEDPPTRPDWLDDVAAGSAQRGAARR